MPAEVELERIRRHANRRDWDGLFNNQRLLFLYRKSIAGGLAAYLCL